MYTHFQMPSAPRVHQLQDADAHKVKRFDKHDGPVCGIAFHPSKPLFVSGGDDYKTKVWNCKQQRCLFTLHGHLDSVQSGSFHRKHPWIPSASDDQTICIWNWQSHQCSATLTGHYHYIMCAKCHPEDNYTLSCSMDQTLRVWDIAGLQKKTTMVQPMSLKDQVQHANSGQAELFGDKGVVVKYVLKCHDCGVIWATFRPTLPVIKEALKINEQVKEPAIANGQESSTLIEQQTTADEKERAVKKEQQVRIYRTHSPKDSHWRGLLLNRMEAHHVPRK
ncbi:uncharacterized protein MELLADRAFT_91605 [Melampsora larici-populina 98AG31]|uniref:Uncharacterized protein n=1 Tax=Melampsora larici-populina (strain 98AG31 / pathotype 3-4-7) TaxID=747676 RepID=F4RZM7_MELLP|nr:uncharacterized protein MELLADRAFT_91605 [Melampsora larici-populina 98AG31]EGG02163.1 hypothetical protein MELLADRAFT_91605 [Melampsora larici-populina 98AG31]